MGKVTIENLKELDYKSNEAYKTLRTNVAFCGKKIKVIDITSCAPGEGKSVVSFHLAMSLAEAGKKVVFIDADLRKSVLLGRYHLDQEVKGLTHYLTGIIHKEEVIYETNIKNLSMIFAGPVPPNPAELLGNKYSTTLIDELRDEYDYVIIDTPPLGSVIDSAIIAAKSDGAILVVEANSHSYRMIASVKTQLEKAGCKILGAVLNKVDMDSKSYYSHYSGKLYKKYSKYYLAE
ncbi:MAG: tyrosine protein kinase [Herbinix sp.]|jgi:capsular exopolysaccharide synthesis family protein|nr:tyrosine protein kinase [Herbinix sp.]